MKLIGAELRCRSPYLSQYQLFSRQCSEPSELTLHIVGNFAHTGLPFPQTIFIYPPTWSRIRRLTKSQCIFKSREGARRTNLNQLRIRLIRFNARFFYLLRFGLAQARGFEPLSYSFGDCHATNYTTPI